MESLMFFLLLQSDVSEAYQDWAYQGGGHVPFLFLTDDVKDVKANFVACWCTPLEALQLMLDGSGLRVNIEEEDGEKFITLLPFKDGYCHPEMGAAAPLPPCKRKDRSYVRFGRMEGYLRSEENREALRGAADRIEALRQAVFWYDTTGSYSGD